MQHIGGFMQSTYTLPPGECLCRIGPADAMVVVNVVEQKHTKQVNFNQSNKL
jgi:hypothetical protein